MDFCPLVLDGDATVKNQTARLSEWPTIWIALMRNAKQKLLSVAYLHISDVFVRNMFIVNKFVCIQHTWFQSFVRDEVNIGNILRHFEMCRLASFRKQCNKTCERLRHT